MEKKYKIMERKRNIKLWKMEKKYNIMERKRNIKLIGNVVIINITEFTHFLPSIIMQS